MYSPKNETPRLALAGHSGQMGKRIVQSVTGADSANIGGEVTAHEFRRPRLSDLACTCILTGTCWTCRQWARLLARKATRVILETGFANYRGASVGAAI